MLMNTVIPTYRLAVKMFAKKFLEGRETMVLTDGVATRLADHIALVEKNGAEWIDVERGYLIFGDKLICLSNSTTPRWVAQMHGAGVVLRVAGKSEGEG